MKIIKFISVNCNFHKPLPIIIMGRDPVELAKRAKYKPPAMRVRGVCYTKKSPFHL